VSTSPAKDFSNCSTTRAYNPAKLNHYAVYRTFDIQFESYTMAWILKGSAYLFMGKHQDTPTPEYGSHA
jgi:hypothetical protein